MINHNQSALFSGGAVDPGPDNANYAARALLNGGQGFDALNRQLSNQRRVQVAEASRLWSRFQGSQIHPLLMLEALQGNFTDYSFNSLRKEAPSIFNESMTRGDFTNLTTFVQDRIMFEAYAGFPKSYEQFCSVNRNIKDFRAVERWVYEGGEAPYQKVGETAGFNRTAPKTDKYTYQVYKYEKGAGMSWEAVVNDDMDMFARVPTGLAEGGLRTVEQLALNLIAGATGPKSTLYGAAIALKPTGTIDNRVNTSGYSTGTWTGALNPKLDVLNLIIASGMFMNQMTYEGRPINPMADDLIVVVGDGVLYQTLMAMKEAVQLSTTVLGGVKASSAVTSDVQMQSRNWIAGRLRPVFAPELRNICTSNLGTSWWMFASPGGPRPCVELGFYKGFDTPQLFKKAPNTQRVSGGLEEMHGDFETMSTEYKGLIVVGGTTMDPRLTAASNGTGS